MKSLFIDSETAHIRPCSFLTHFECLSARRCKWIDESYCELRDNGIEPTPPCSTRNQIYCASSDQCKWIDSGYCEDR